MHTSAYLTLPAQQGEIQDAMDQARIMDGQGKPEAKWVEETMAEIKRIS